MKIARLALRFLPLLAAATALACASSSTAGVDIGRDAPEPFGGQTGSLLPREQLAPLAQGGGMVPAGKTAVVVYTDHPEDVDVTLVAADGTRQELELLPLANGGFAAQAASPLTPGDYTVETEGLANAEDTDAPTPLVVVDRATLPANLGTITQVPAPDGEDPCELAWFELTLASDVIPFASLVGLMVSVDDSQVAKWVDFGALDLHGNKSLLRLDPCGFGGCFYPGQHSLKVVGTLPTEATQTSLEGVLEIVPCGTVQCSLLPRARRREGPNRAAWLGLVCLLVGAGIRRRSRGARAH